MAAYAAHLPAYVAAVAGFLRSFIQHYGPFELAI
jgi:hypothetical protein